MAIKRWQILSAIKTRMETISVANGYYSAVGSNVFLMRNTPLQDAELPALNIYREENEVDTEFITNEQSLTDFALTVVIDVVCKSGTTTLQSVEEIIADVYKAISTDDKWSTYAHTTDTISDKIVIVEQVGDTGINKVVGGATIRIKVYYRTTKWLES